MIVDCVVCLIFNYLLLISLLTRLQIGIEEELTIHCIYLI